MSNLDPFIVQWPQQWVEDPEIGPVINYLNLFLHDLFVILDGGQAVEDSEANNSSVRAKIGALSSLINNEMMQTNNRAEIAVLSKRISDLEQQQ